MNKQILRSFSFLMRQLGNVTAQTARKFPLFVFILLALLFFLGTVISKNPYFTVGLLCAVVTLVSTIIYKKTRNYGETALTFILGLFTVFSISWDPYKVRIFIAFFVAFTAIIFIISSSRVSMKKESILTQASIYYDFENQKAVYQSFDKLSNLSREYAQLNSIKRAECIRYFAFRQIPIDEMQGMLTSVELISTVTAIGHLKVAEFICTLYTTFKTSPQSDKAISHIKEFVDNMLSFPCPPEDFFQIFDYTRKYLLLNKVSFAEYLDLLKEHTRLGLTPEDIASIFRKRFET